MIDPDRDYLLSKVIDFNETLFEYKRELEAATARINQLTEANATALATAEGWRKSAMRNLDHYDEVTLALEKKWGEKKQTKFLRKLGHLPEV